jgi:predicted cupin superfamily sugar epimerase
MASTHSAEAVIAALGLEPHPEGGHFAETYRHRPEDGGRGAMTAIYYLLRAGEHSRWHRVRDADELWHHYAGAPLELRLSPDGRHCETLRLGPDLGRGERPQVVVAAGCWQAARPLGEWTLAGCTVGPAFEFAGFELAPHGWQPG